jgi:hypothetical protein
MSNTGDDIPESQTTNLSLEPGDTHVALSVERLFKIIAETVRAMCVAGWFCGRHEMLKKHFFKQLMPIFDKIIIVDTAINYEVYGRFQRIVTFLTSSETTRGQYDGAGDIDKQIKQISELVQSRQVIGRDIELIFREANLSYIRSMYVQM